MELMVSLGANYSEKNAFGTGNSVSVGINYSEWRQDISFNFYDPYFTIDGIGLDMEHFIEKLITVTSILLLTILILMEEA